MYIDELKRIVSEIITPRLRILGFTKSSYNYYKKSDDFGICFNLQPDKYNSQDEVKFTFNVGTYLPSAYEIYTRFFTDAPLDKFPKEYHCINRVRLCALKGSRIDHWYLLNNSVNKDVVYKEVTDDLDGYLIPYIKSINKEKLLDTTVNSNYGNNTDKIVLTIYKIQNGYISEGTQILNNLLKEDNNEYFRKVVLKTAQKFNLVIE